MDKKTILWKLACALLIMTTAVLLLSGVLGGDLLYQLPDSRLP